MYGKIEVGECISDGNRTLGTMRVWYGAGEFPADGVRLAKFVFIHPSWISRGICVNLFPPKCDCHVVSLACRPLVSVRPPLLRIGGPCSWSAVVGVCFAVSAAFGDQVCGRCIRN